MVNTADPQIRALQKALCQTWWNIGLLGLLLLAFLGGIIYAALFAEDALKRKEDAFLADVRQRIRQDAGWLTEEMVQDAFPLPSVVPVQDWAKAPEPRVKVTVRARLSIIIPGARTGSNCPVWRLKYSTTGSAPGMLPSW